MDDLLSEFLTESAESLESLDAELVKLERNQNDPDLISGIFRLMHTIKGTCGFLGLPRLEAVAHAGENVLGNFRDGVQEVTPEAVSLVLKAIDRIKSLLADLEQKGVEPQGDDSDLIEQLNALYCAGRDSKAVAPAAPIATSKKAAAPAPEAKSAAQPKPAAAPMPVAVASEVYERIGGAATLDAATEIALGKIRANADFAPFLYGIDPSVLQGRLVEYIVQSVGGPSEYGGPQPAAIGRNLAERDFTQTHLDRALAELDAALATLDVCTADAALVIEGVRSKVREASGDFPATVPAKPVRNPTPDETVPTAAKRPAPAEASHAPHAQAAEHGEPGQAKESAVANQSIRVNVEVLENLMTMVSELVLTRNQLLQMVRKLDDSEFKAPLQRLSHVTSELQESVMKTRMQPIGNAWGRLPRIVRDLSVELGKKIELDMHGANTELDRQVLDMIKDPLTHMVRNSADHGLELPAERRRAGKLETGRILLDAYHEGGRIIVKVQDDGRGIDVAKVKKKIVSTGLATQAELTAMPEQQILQFIFRAGFSTAENVTAVSGRGVGMDVVRTNVEKIGGQIELSSVGGKGSTFTIKIPLTLAIMSALIVECGGERFAISQLSVVELVRVSRTSERRIETINDTPVLRLRDRLLPLISLNHLLKLDATAADAGAQTNQAKKTGARQEMFVIVVQVSAYRFGLVVDGVHDTEEIVVKPVAPILRHLGIYSGTTILGDGNVIMILDPNGIAAASGEITIADKNQAAARSGSDATASDRVAFLVFRAGSAESKAVPLALVARLEEFDAATIETSNSAPVVQYRGKLLPLVSVDPVFKAKTSGRQPVVVLGDGDTTIGALVDEIVDIVEDTLDVHLGSSREGTLGTAIISGKATEVIDVATYFGRVRGDWFTARKTNGDKRRAKKRLLLVDDSAFFRNLITPILTAAGYAVTGVSSAGDALEMRRRGDVFDVIVSDIEMPGMDGFEFARSVRADGPWKETPIIALSSHATPEDFAMGREAGFVDYVAKLDRTALLESLSQSNDSLKGAAA